MKEIRLDWASTGKALGYAMTVILASTYGLGTDTETAKKLRHRYESNGEPANIANTIYGALGEAAVSDCLRALWSVKGNNFGGADLCEELNLGVRTRHNKLLKYRDFTIREDEIRSNPDRCHVLVHAHRFPVMEIHGFAFGREIDMARCRTQTLGNGVVLYCLAPDEIHPIEEFPREMFVPLYDAWRSTFSVSRKTVVDRSLPLVAERRAG